MNLFKMKKKFYLLHHPEYFYLKSKDSYDCSWTEDPLKAKVWSYENHPKNVKIQSTNKTLNDCDVICMEFEFNSYTIQMLEC